MQIYIHKPLYDKLIFLKKFLVFYKNKQSFISHYLRLYQKKKKKTINFLFFIINNIPFSIIQLLTC